MRLPTFQPESPGNTYLSAGMTLLRGVPDSVLRLVCADLTFPRAAFGPKRGAQPEDGEDVDDDVCMWREAPDGILVPRYYWRPELASFGRVEMRRGDVGDFRHILRFPPRPHQVEIVRKIETITGDFGLAAPPATGKTYLSLLIASRTPGRILINAHSAKKFGEWRDEVKKFMGLEDSQIGTIRGKVLDWEQHPVTIAMAKTLSLRELPMEVQTGFATEISDEIHAMNSAEISRSLGATGGRRISLSATPGRGLRLKVVHLHRGANWLHPEVDRLPCRVEFVPVPVGKWFQKMDWERLTTMWGRDDFYVRTAANITGQLMAQKRRVLVLSNQTKPLYQVFHHLNRVGGFVVGAQSIREMAETDPTLMSQVMATEQTNWERRCSTYMDVVCSRMNPVLGTGLTKLQPAGTGMSIDDLDGGVIMIPTGNPDTAYQIIGRFDREHPSKQKPLIVVMVPHTQEGMRTGQSMQMNLRRIGKGKIEIYEHPPIGRAY